jgi:ankyrin repeat protein
LGYQLPGKTDFPIHRAVLDGFFHELDLTDECMKASLKNSMHDFDQTLHTPLMLAVRSGRYEDVQAMLSLCNIDFSLESHPSAWDLAILIGDPKMISIMKTGRENQ